MRFDGIKFKIFNTINAPAIKSNRITNLFEDKNGTLWIGTQYGNVISYKNETFTSVLEPPIIQRRAVQAFCVDKNGVIWTTGLQKFTPVSEGKYVSEQMSLPGELNPLVGSIVEDDSGGIWISTFKGLYQYQNDVFKYFPFENTFPPLNLPATIPGGPPSVKIFIDSKKQLWLSGINGLARFENGEFIPLIRKQNAFISIAENIDHTYLLNTDRKIHRFAGDKIGETLIDEPDKFALFRLMMTDREGNLWIGSTGGLVRFKKRTARTFAKADGLTDFETNFVFEDRDKNLWVGADGLYKFREGKFENVSGSAGMNFGSAFQSVNGTLWFGTRENGILTSKDGKFSHYGKENNIEGSIVYEDSRGILFFPTREILTIKKAGNIEKIPLQNGGVQARSGRRNLARHGQRSLSFQRRRFC